MPIPANASIVNWVRRLTYTAMAAVMGITAGAFWRWGQMTTVWNGLTHPTLAMNPLTALCLAGVIFSLAMLMTSERSSRRYKKGQSLAGLVVGLSALRLIQYA